MGKAAFLVACALFAQVSSLPTVHEDSPFPINWDNIKPKYPTYTPWDPKDLMPEEMLRSIVNMGPPTSERLPGYKKGTESMGRSEVLPLLRQQFCPCRRGCRTRQ